MSIIGLRIAKKGTNVKTATPPEIIVGTEFKDLPIALTGKFDKTGNAGTTGVVTVKHGLGFVPFLIAYYKTSAFPTKWQWIPSSGDSWLLGDFTQITQNNMRVDTENIVFRIDFGNTTPETVTVRYIVFNFPIAMSL